MLCTRLSVPRSAVIADHDIVDQRAVLSRLRPRPTKARRDSCRSPVGRMSSHGSFQFFWRASDPEIKPIGSIPKNVGRLTNCERVVDPVHEAVRACATKLDFKLILRDLSA